MYGVIAIRLIIATGSQWPSRPHPWVAKITGLDRRYGLSREFRKAIYDYSNATKNGKNTVAYYFLPPGLYEIYYPTSWKHEYRGFQRVDEAGERTEITREEIIKCLKKECLE